VIRRTLLALALLGCGVKRQAVTADAGPPPARIEIMQLGAFPSLVLHVTLIESPPPPAGMGLVVDARCERKGRLLIDRRLVELGDLFAPGKPVPLSVPLFSGRLLPSLPDRCEHVLSLLAPRTDEIEPVPREIRRFCSVGAVVTTGGCPGGLTVPAPPPAPVIEDVHVLPSAGQLSVTFTGTSAATPLAEVPLKAVCAEGELRHVSTTASAPPRRLAPGESFRGQAMLHTEAPLADTRACEISSGEAQWCFNGRITRAGSCNMPPVKVPDAPIVLSKLDVKFRKRMVTDETSPQVADAVVSLTAGATPPRGRPFLISRCGTPPDEDIVPVAVRLAGVGPGETIRGSVVLHAKGLPAVPARCSFSLVLTEAERPLATDPVVGSACLTDGKMELAPCK
jgi:hypothetical protein